MTLRERVDALVKHADHDQSTHGNWAHGIRRVVAVSETQAAQFEADIDSAVQMLSDYGFTLPPEYSRGDSTDIKFHFVPQSQVTRQSGRDTNAYVNGRSIVMGPKWKRNPGGLARNRAETIIHELGHILFGDSQLPVSGFKAPSDYAKKPGEFWAESFLATITGRADPALAAEIDWKLGNHDALVKHAAPIHPGTGTDQSVHGKPVVSMSGKPGTIFDENPAKPFPTRGDQAPNIYREAVEAIFDAKLETNGSTYTAVTDDVRTYGGGELIFEGKLFNSDGDRIAGFSAWINPKEGLIRDIAFFMEGYAQDEGIGTMFIAHWMEEATSAGFHRFEVGTTEVGQYAWAMAGFDWDEGSMDHHMTILDAAIQTRADEDFDIEDFFQRARPFDEDLYLSIPSDYVYMVETMKDTFINEFGGGWQAEAEELVERWKAGEHVTPLEVALLGVDDKRELDTTSWLGYPGRSKRSMHFGKAFMLTADTWHGFLELGEVKKSLDAHFIWRRWAKTDPRAIEQDDARFLNDISATVIRKHGGPGPHAGTGTPQKVHGKPVSSYGSHPETGTIFDDRPAQDRGRFVELLDAKEIFEATLELNGETYIARVTVEDPESIRSTSTEVNNTLHVSGVIEHRKGSMLDPVGSFTRYLYENRVVYNDSLNINPDHRGSGVGTMFLSHWEDELAAAGFREMEVTAVNIGRYAWAVAGYDYATVTDREEAVGQLELEVQIELEADRNPSWLADAQAVLDKEKPTPLDFALIGQGTPYSGDMHYGKSFMLGAPSWTGHKPIGVKKSLDAARAVWKRWAENDPRAVEQDDSAFLSELAVAALYISKHAGPGPHPGTMTEQTVHGRGAGLEDDEMDLSEIDHQTTILTTEPHRARNVSDWAQSRIRQARDHLSGLYASENYTGIMESRMGSWIQRLTTLYYRARNVEEEVANNPAIALVKHGGPGPHAGTGTPQAIHAGEKRIASVVENNWADRTDKPPTPLPYSIVRNVKMKGVHSTHSGSLVKLLKTGFDPLKSSGGVLGTGIYASFGEFSGKEVQENYMGGPELDVDINFKKAIFINSEDWNWGFSTERTTAVIIDALEQEGAKLYPDDRAQLNPDFFYQKLVNAGFDGIIYSRGDDPNPDWEWGSQVVAMTPESIKWTRLRTLGGHSVGNWARDMHDLMSVSVPGLAEAMAEEGLLDYEPPARRYGNVKLPVINKANTLPAIVWTWADFERWLKADAIVKHYGPGPHPGTGTDQAVHGGGAGGPSSDEGLFDDTPYTEAPDPEAENREQYPDVFKLIDRGKEVRAGLDARMEQAELEALSMVEQEAKIEERRVLVGEWSTTAGNWRSRVNDKLVRRLKQHFPDVGSERFGDNRIRNAWHEADGDFEKFKDLMAGSYDTDISFETTVTPAMANKLTSEYWGEMGYGFDTSREAGVTFDGKTFTVPNTAAGDALLSDVENRSYLAYSNSERGMWDRLSAKLREAGYNTRRSKTAFEFKDPEVWVRMSPSTEVIMSGRNLGNFWTQGPGKSYQYVKATGKWEDVDVDNKGIYVPINTGAEVYGKNYEEGDQNGLLLHAIFDPEIMEATTTPAGVVNQPPDDREGWQRMPLSRVTESMAREYRHWDEAQVGFAGRVGSLNKESVKLRGDKAAVYREAFRDWLGQYRETGGDINIMRRTAKVESFLQHNQVYPTEWLETSNNKGRLSVTHASSRGHYTEVGYTSSQGLQLGEGRIKTDGRVDTNVHEMGHRLEHTYMPLYEAEQEFYRMRTNGRSVSNMQKERPGSGYRSYELTVPDDFSDPYMGKEYAAGYELISMSMPRLVQQWPVNGELPYRKKEQPYNLDEQMLHWVLGVLVDV